jgi:colicin import membrane protein
VAMDSVERLAELEAERQEVVGELAREVADMSPEARERWTRELEAAGLAPAEAEQYVQGLQQLGLDAQAREAELEQERFVAEREEVERGEAEIERAERELLIQDAIEREPLPELEQGRDLHAEDELDLERQQELEADRMREVQHRDEVSREDLECELEGPELSR